MRPVTNSEMRQLLVPADSVDRGTHVVVSYRLIHSADHSPDDIAALFALNTFLGTVPALHYEAPEGKRLAETGRVLHVQGGKGHTHVSIAYPTEFALQSVGLPQLLSVLWYNAEYNFIDGYRVDDIELPKSYLAGCRGPRFGIAGIRKKIGIESRPLLGVVLKPRVGVPLDTLADVSYRALIGGADLLMDDELVVDPAGDMAFGKRVPRLAKVAAAAQRHSDGAKWYVANVNSAPRRALALARRAVDAGANAILVNGFALGFVTLEEFVSCLDAAAPVFSCNMGTALLSRPEQVTGASEVVISKLSRLAGADAVYCGILSSEWYKAETFRGSLSALKSPWADLPSTFPVVAGGLTIRNVLDNLIVHGTDVVLLAGRGILGFSTSADDGARALRKVISAYQPGMSQQDVNDCLFLLGQQDDKIRGALKSYGFERLSHGGRQ